MSVVIFLLNYGDQETMIIMSLIHCVHLTAGASLKEITWLLVITFY